VSSKIALNDMESLPCGSFDGAVILIVSNCANDVSAVIENTADDEFGANVIVPNSVPFLKIVKIDCVAEGCNEIPEYIDAEVNNFILLGTEKIIIVSSPETPEGYDREIS
jgi:hypothetical protein